MNKKKTGKAKAKGKANKRVKDLPAKTLSARNARDVKGGRKAGKEQHEYLIVKMNDILIT